MEPNTSAVNYAKGKMVGDIKAAMTDGDDLLRATANASRSGIAEVCDKFDEKLSGAAGKILNAARPSMERATRTAGMANDYVHGNPWAMMGLAMIAGALISFWAAKR